MIDDLKKKVVIAKKPPLYTNFAKVPSPKMFNPNKKTRLKPKKVLKAESRLKQRPDCYRRYRTLTPSVLKETPEISNRVYEVSTGEHSK